MATINNSIFFVLVFFLNLLNANAQGRPLPCLCSFVKCEEVKEERVNKIISLKSKEVIVLTSEGGYKVKKQKKLELETLFKKKMDVSAYTETNDGSLWIVYNDKLAKLTNDSIEDVCFLRGRFGFVSDLLFSQKSDSVWFASTQGLYKISMEDIKKPLSTTLERYCFKDDKDNRTFFVNKEGGNVILGSYEGLRMPRNGLFGKTLASVRIEKESFRYYKQKKKEEEKDKGKKPAASSGDTWGGGGDTWGDAPAQTPAKGKKPATKAPSKKHKDDLNIETLDGYVSDFKETDIAYYVVAYSTFEVNKKKNSKGRIYTKDRLGTRWREYVRLGLDDTDFAKHSFVVTHADSVFTVLAGKTLKHYRRNREKSESDSVSNCNIRKIIGSLTFNNIGSLTFNNIGATQIDNVFLLGTNKGLYRVRLWPFQCDSAYSLPINFVVDSTTITEEHKKILQPWIEYLKQDRELKIIIEGHANKQADNLNADLISKDRAKAVEAYLLANKVAKDQILEVIGKGNKEPLVFPEKTILDSKKNQRVVIRPICPKE